MAQPEQVFPVYLLAGFLDSGKTTFINNILSDGFAAEDKTLLISCEEGETEYENLRNVTVLSVDDPDLLTPEFLLFEQEKCGATQIIVELNGMWNIGDFYSSMPESWILYQIVALADARTFEMYSRNMTAQMMDKLRNADMIVIKHCNEELRLALRKRNLRLVNRQADIYLENEDGTSEDYANDDTPPFDMDQEIIDIPDDDYGIWFVDIMDRPERYQGKLVHMKMVMCHSKQYPGIDCPGRFAMVCCEDDITFLGLIARGEGLDKFKNHDWIEVTARRGIPEHKAYDGAGPVMDIISIAPCEQPATEVVSF